METKPSFLSTVRKTVVAAIAAAVIIFTAVQDKEISNEEWVTIAGALGGVVAVWGVRNRQTDEQLVVEAQERNEIF